MQLHASCVAIGELAILIIGDAQTGKSSLAFELISRGATLIADDQTLLHAKAGHLIASCPPELSGLIEMAGVGVLHAPETTHQAAVAFEVHLTKNATERMPEPITATYQGITIQKLTLRACDNTNAAKILFLTQVFQQTGAIQTVSIAKPPAKD